MLLQIYLFVYFIKKTHFSIPVKYSNGVSRQEKMIMFDLTWYAYIELVCIHVSVWKT